MRRGSARQVKEKLEAKDWRLEIEEDMQRVSELLCCMPFASMQHRMQCRKECLSFYDALNYLFINAGGISSAEGK